MKKLFLVTPQCELNSFVHKSDRLFFSTPVEVVPFACSVGTLKDHLLYVEEVKRKERYPVSTKFLKHEHQLTRKQHQSAH